MRSSADGGNFLTQRNFRVILSQTATVAVAALGMTVVIISGGIDLSAGTALALSATVLASALRADVAPWAAVLLGVASGGLCGLINGALISLLRMVPFIVTLGTMTALPGLCQDSWRMKRLSDRPSIRFRRG